jgi:hypothetical protein
MNAGGKGWNYRFLERTTEAESLAPSPQLRPDPVTAPPQDDNGSKKHGKRRSPRVLVSVPVEIFALGEDGSLLHEQGETEVVSAHGALLRMNEDLPDMQQGEIILGHPPNWTLGWVLESYPPKEDGRTRIAVEFSVPRQNFWLD